MKKQTNMPHAGHFVCGRDCSFHLNTYVNGYIVSTVGEYQPSTVFEEVKMKVNGKMVTHDVHRARREDDPPAEIGHKRLYETMVFAGKRSTEKCCPYVAKRWKDLDFAGYNDAGAAYQGHLKMVKKWSTKRGPR